MAEEHRCKAPEGHRLCANKCGLFGNPTPMDLCSNCFRLKNDQQSSAKPAVERSNLSVLPPGSPPPLYRLLLCRFLRSVTESTGAASSPAPNRCFSCRKRVGLMGIRCRCGSTFCGSHRYPEKHGCTFDFKAAGREAIARANPLVKAQKLDKI